MSAETKRQEHSRLQKRTDELRQEHADLALDRKPFDQDEHDEHKAHLKKHKEDLTVHRGRGNEESEG
jgi:hypothetical protein